VRRLSLGLIQREVQREIQRNSDQVQGVHNVKKLASFEEPAQDNARWARSIFFPRKSFELSYSKSQECKVCVGGRNPVKDRSSEEITLSTSVDEISEMDSSGEQRVETFESG
jgi:hypothetical protein